MLICPSTGGDWGRLFHWRCADIDFDFLRGDMHFWFPIDHVFRFGVNKLCLTYEFSWFLGQAKNLSLAVLAQDVGPRQALAKLLGVDARVFRYMFV